MPDIISRDDAAAKGLKRYFTGEPCAKRGHISERFTSNGGCIMCVQRLVPNKMSLAKNIGWPAVGLVFASPGVTQDEKEAAFRYIEAMRWHDYAVMEMRKNPALLAQYRTQITPIEVAKLEATLAQARSRAPLQEALITLACGFGQHYYGEPKMIGDLITCNHCKKLQRITKIE